MMTAENDIQQEELPRTTEKHSGIYLLWDEMPLERRLAAFWALPLKEAEDFFVSLDTPDQSELLCSMPEPDRKLWIRLLPPDDAADLIQYQDDPAERERMLALLDEAAHKEVVALLAYAEDVAGGLMNPRYARIRPEMTVDEAIAYVRKQAVQNLETIYYVYVIDSGNHLVGALSFRELLLTTGNGRIRDVMRTELVTIHENADQEELSHLFSDHDLIAIPVLDSQGRMKGIVTVDDIVDVVREEAAEDAHKFGGMAPLEEPYLDSPFWAMVRKRGGWLTVLFFGEMLTATAMSEFEHAISKVVVLALFIPLIISSGGNSGSQASTLVIQAMALGEATPKDWRRVLRRELASGLALGAILGLIGFIRVVIWEWIFHSYGDHYVELAATVFFSLTGVVIFGTLCGSMLPFVMKRLGLDPASASAPFVATLVDVMGVVIYFSIASVLLAKLMV